MRYRWQVVLLITAVVLVVVAVRYWRPAILISPVPYDLAVQEVRALYPIPGSVKELPADPRYGDIMAIRRVYPAYGGYRNPLWDLQVRHSEEIAGQLYRIEIVNSAKFERRESAVFI